MRKVCLIVSMCGLVGVWTGPAAATTIHFENLPSTPFVSYYEAGVLFTAVDGTELQRFGDVPNDTWGLTGLAEFYPELRADFAKGATSVSVDLGDYAGVDAETIFLEIYDSSGVSLGSVSKDIPKDQMKMTTLSLSARHLLCDFWVAEFRNRQRQLGSCRQFHILCLPNRICGSGSRRHPAWCDRHWAGRGPATQDVVTDAENSNRGLRTPTFGAPVFCVERKNVGTPSEIVAGPSATSGGFI